MPGTNQKTGNIVKKRPTHHVVSPEIWEGQVPRLKIFPGKKKIERGGEVGSGASEKEASKFQFQQHICEKTLRLITWGEPGAWYGSKNWAKAVTQ